MPGFDDPAFYGDRWAAGYDELHTDLDPSAAVEFLAALADGGHALELGVGTGRVALPLAARGLKVSGIDASSAMAARLRAKPGGDAIPVTIGDIADVPAEGPFGLVYGVFNILFCLLSPERQAACFRNVARVLDPGGLMVIECLVPDPARFDRGQRVHALEVTQDSATIEVSVHHAAEQRITTQIIRFDQAGVQLGPLALRYSWPAELDLMAAQAGLALRDRYGDWDRRPFTAASGKHISAYQPGRPGRPGRPG